jgi:alpha-ketoglutarate-dependent taurine dioxygenase
MAPIAVEQTTSTATTDISSLKAALATTTLTDVEAADLRAFAHIETTPSIGTEFILSHDPAVPSLDIQDVLASPAKLKALSTLVAERGVVFFRQAKITPDEQRVLVDALGRASGKPATSGLHTHPLTLPNSKYGDEITHITNQFVLSDKFDYKDTRYSERTSGKVGWVSLPQASKS